MSTYRVTPATPRSHPVNLIRREPALISAAVSTVIALVIAFGVDLSADKVGAIMAVVAAVLALVVRGAVTPNVSVAATADPQGLSGAVAGPAADQADGTPVSVVTSTLHDTTPFNG